MANCFGPVVDNYKLDESLCYLGKTKTKEDRAREAMKILRNEGGKNQSADSYVHGLKQEYDTGQTTLCLIYNAAGGPLHYVEDHDWEGNLGRTPYPTVIGNVQWATFLHAQSFADNKVWRTPQAQFKRNKAYCEIGPVNGFQYRWSGLYDKLKDSDYHSEDKRDGLEVTADTATGNSPVFQAEIKIPLPE